MNNYKTDNRVVMTLDAGGTNFVFSAFKGCKQIVDPIRFPSNADNLDKCLIGIIEGFKAIQSLLPETPSAISFAFPGPADYPNGIIGDLNNLPAFKGGVALGAMLEDIFGIPVYINNDGDLYAYGESIDGILPWVNNQLKQRGSLKRYKNVLGVTLGTGFGGGIVHDGHLILGDNSAAAEVWAISNKYNTEENIEELISIRAVRKGYAKISGIDIADAPTPKEIYDIAIGAISGDRAAALKSYENMGAALGDVLSNLMTVVDGIAVIGGGVSGAKDLFMPATLKVMRGKHDNGNPRLAQKVYYLDDESQLDDLAKGESKKIKVPFSDKYVDYDPLFRIAVGTSRIGTSEAISIGAYSYAVKMLNRRDK